MRLYWSRVGPNSMIEEIHRHTQREGSNMKMEAETEVMLPQAKDAKDFQQSPEARKKHGVDSPSEPPGRTNPADTLTLSFWPPEL